MNTDIEWHRLVNMAIEGPITSPRSRPTREILHQVTHTPIDNPVLSCVGRKLNYGFMFREAHWILSGSNDPRPLITHIKNYGKYARDTRHIQWAYGPRVVDQLCYIKECLDKDRASRQAVMSIWTPNPRWDDPPCTLSLQFILRLGQLQCISTMRSSDVWWGWPYDVFSFSMIAWYVALSLCERPSMGFLTTQMTSSHIYEEHVEKAFKAITGEYREFSPISMYDLKTPDHLMHFLDDMANCPDTYINDY